MSSSTPPEHKPESENSSNSQSTASSQILEIVNRLWRELETFTKQLAELIKSKNWVSLLLLLDVALIIFFSPQSGVVSGLLKIPLNNTFFWVAVGIIFFAALSLAVMEPSSKISDIEPIDDTERKAIKGLRAFTQKDAEIFARLQRGSDLQECLESITSETFRLGILMGESGCGKTSFLKAGIIPRLTHPESDEYAVYIRFSNRDPMETVCEAIVNEFKLSDTQINCSNLLEVLSKSIEAAGDKPIILIFDQFEQFFVHYKQKAERKPFIDVLKEWYRIDDPLSVKILISIRGDLADRLIELQKALDYSLSPQEVFRLERFSPEEATQILRVIAEKEEIKFDEGFVRKLTAEELASNKDGLISPVYLQILAWTIDRQNTSESRAFNRVAFQRIGGIEKLMTRFLCRTLDARVIVSQRQAAIKVLLALTNLDRDVRAGAFTLEELWQRVRGNLTRGEIVDAVVWLSDDRVRLITEIQQNQSPAYELANERLIPAVREVAGRDLTKADEANQLLYRRVNEWLGNQRDSRFLLNWHELSLIWQQYFYINWGLNKNHKEELIQRSKRQLWQHIGGIALTQVLFFGYCGWRRSPWGQISQVREQLEELSKRVGYEEKQQAVVAFVQDKKSNTATEIVASVKDPFDRAKFSVEIAKTHSQLGDSNKAKPHLKEAKDSAKEISNSDDRALAHKAIAEAHAQLENSDEAESHLQAAIDFADQITESDDRRFVIGEIVRTISLLEEKLDRQGKNWERHIDRAARVAEPISDYNNKSLALAAIAETYKGLENNDKAEQYLQDAIANAAQISDYNSKATILKNLAEALGQWKNTTEAKKYLQQANAVSEKIFDPHIQASVVAAFATTFIQIEDTNANEVKTKLNKALALAAQISDSDDIASILEEIVRTIGKIENYEAREYWDRAFALAKKIPNSDNKELALGAIVENSEDRKDLERAIELIEDSPERDDKKAILRVIALKSNKINGSSDANRHLEQAIEATEERIYDPKYQAWVLSAIARAINEIEEPADAKAKYLNSAIEAAEQIGNSDIKAGVINDFTKTQVKLRLWRQANRAVEHCPTDECKVESLALILTAWVNKDKNNSSDSARQNTEEIEF